MDERQSRWLVALSALLALLVLGIVYLEPPAADPEDGRRWTRAAGDRSEETVTGITVRLGGDTMRARREAGAWRWVEPVEVAGDGARIDALVRSVLDVELGQTIDVDPTRVGLGDGAPSVTLELDGAEPLTYRVGEDAPVGSSTYVQDASGAVRATRTRLETALPASIHQLRSRSVVAFPRTDVTRIEIGASVDRPAIAFERNDQGWWFADQTPRLRASETHLHTVVDALRYAEAEAFYDTSPPLTDTARAVTVHHGGSTTTLRLAREPGGAWLASGPEQPGTVALAATDLIALLDSPRSTFTESRVLLLYPTQLQQLTVSLDGIEADASRTENGWSDARAEPLLVALEAGRAARGGVVPEPEGSATGRVQARFGSSETVVELFQALESGDRVARETGTNAPFLVEAGTLKALADALSSGG